MFTEKALFDLGFDHGRAGQPNQVEIAQDDPFDVIAQAGHRAINAYLRGYVDGADVRLAVRA